MSQTISFSNLDIEIKEAKESIKLVFRGDIDEYFDHQRLPPLNPKPLVLDLEDVRNINSVGIRQWVQLINHLGKSETLVYQNCSIAMVDQFNMVPASIGNANVESFYAPYFCNDHGEVNKLISVNNDIAKGIAPQFDCEQCGHPLEFDSLEDTYFMFATGAVKHAG